MLQGCQYFVLYPIFSLFLLCVIARMVELRQILLANNIWHIIGPDDLDDLGTYVNWAQQNLLRIKGTVA